MISMSSFIVLRNIEHKSISTYQEAKKVAFKASLILGSSGISVIIYLKMIFKLKTII